MSRVRAWLRAQSSALILVAIMVALNGASLPGYAHLQGSQQASQHREQVMQQQAARRAGELLEARLCLTFGKLAALKPPADPDPVKNPARLYEQQQHDTLDELGTDLGCGRR